MPGSIIGAAVKRVEDPRFVRGEGTYIPNMAPRGELHAAMVRSPLAHGRIRSIDTSLAETTEGVVAVYTAADLARGLLGASGYGQRRCVGMAGSGQQRDSNYEL